MYLPSSESRSLFIETAAFLPLLMLPSLLSIISSSDDTVGENFSSFSYGAENGAGIGFGAQLRGSPSSRAQGAVLLPPDYAFLTEKTEIVSRKLESMASGKSVKSGVSLRELRAALNELREHGTAFEFQVKQALPSIHLLADLLGAMDLSNTLISNQDAEGNSDESSLQAQSYITRLETQYKFLRPFYVTRKQADHAGNNYNADSDDDDGDNEQENSDVKAKTIKTTTVIRAMLALKDHETLTTNLLAEALIEYVESLQKFNELDLDKNLTKKQEQLGLTLSYLNTVEVRLLGKHIFPKLHLLSSQEELKNLKKLYRKELFKSGLIVEDGQLRLVGGLEPTPNCERCSS